MKESSVKKRKESPTQYFDSKEGKFCVYEVYPKSKKTIYYIQGSQAKYLSKITLEGYQGLPPGIFLYKDGYGFSKKGIILLATLKRYLGANKVFNLTICSSPKKSIIQRSNDITLIISYDDFRSLLLRLGRISEDNNQHLREAIASFLSTKFPKKIQLNSINFDEYSGGEIAAILRRNNVAKKLNDEDLRSLQSFFPQIFEAALKSRKNLTLSQRGVLIEKTKNTTDKIFLDEVIKEFERNLAKKNLSEEVWQKFLGEKVFRFLANYITSIEKQNISLDISYPDFVLADVYGFIDVFEIKRPDTPLLAFDDSHENYYWKQDVVKAVAQIENYIDKVISNADDYIRAIKRKKHIDIRVVRPRGYIIAGTSKQFGNKKESEDFRKLGTSLKNISFILYDELLENLKNLRSKLQ